MVMHMPYKRVDNVIFKKEGTRWRFKQKCGSVKKANNALDILNQLDSDFNPPKVRRKHFRL